MQQTGIRRCHAERLRLGLTLRQLADRCAEHGILVGWSTLAKIERGESVPRPQLRAVLANILDLDVEAFERGAE